MSVTAHIYRILLAALLLLVPSRATDAAPARLGSDVPCGLFPTAQCRIAGEERHAPLKDAVLLHPWLLSSAACVQGGHSGGPGGCTGLYPAATYSRVLRYTGSTTELRRRQLLFSAVRHAQLRARYPEHGFW